MSSSIAIPGKRVSHRRDTAALEAAETRFDRRLSEILAHATEAFREKGYEGSSMRDLSRATGMSLAGLYHYFGSKERLLYLIQKHAFSTIIEQLKARLHDVDDPAQRIRIFIQNHLEYFVANQSGLKVLAHEDEALKNGFASELTSIKREYYRICVGLMDDLKRERRIEFNSRTAVMSLFGMINWIYTWYNPRVDGTAEDLARQMSNIILAGVGSGVVASTGSKSFSSRAAHRESIESLSSRAVRRRSRGRARDLHSAPPAKSVLKRRGTKRAPSKV